MRSYFLSFILLLSFLASSSLSASAQEQTTASTDSLVTRANIKDNTIFWQQEKLVQHKGGQLFEVQDAIEYPNGTVVFSDGRVRTHEGKTLTLKQKHAINPQGRVVLVADDIFTYATIIGHERQTVGDTETKIVVIDGKIASVASGDEKQVYNLGREKKIKLLEQKIKLLEQRAKLLETALTDAERQSIEAYYNGLNRQIANVNHLINILPPAVKPQ